MTHVGIIGCGSIAKFHYEGYEKCGAKIAHVCDIRTQAAQVVADRYGARASTDYRAVLDDPKVQLVSICTIASSHKEIALAALAAGKGVICEKTLTDNPADSFELFQASRKTSAFFATAYMKRFYPATQQAKKLLAEMGRIISIYARSWQHWDLWNSELNESTRAPSHILRVYGGGVLVCGGSHILDLIQHLAGRPTQVVGQMHTREGMDVDIQANAMLWLKDGGLAHFETCWHPLQFAGREKNGWDERLEINTISGRLDLYTTLWNKPANNGSLLVHEANDGKITEYRFPAINPFDVEMAELVRRFEANEPAWPTALDGYVVDEIIDTIARSAAQNRILPMAWKTGDL